ncbi:MAG TPA: hypothetical protein PLF13_11145 [candidate division Zixibacteria bacterium]|nr:hypothetical protein [candidate division Zixibacteria bacterium]
MRAYIAINIALLLVLTVIPGCSDQPPTAPTDDGSQTTPIATAQSEPGAEAQAMALWLGGEIAVSDSLAISLDAEMASIRDRFLDSVPEVAIEFCPPWQSGKIVVGFEETTYDSVLAGEYRAWDSLNLVYGFDSVVVGTYHPSLAWAVLEFTEPLNPVLLAQAYEQLPGITFATPNRFIGDGPMLLAWPDDDARIYFFRKAWGDCLAGCIYSQYDIFRVVESEPTYLGHFESTVNIPLYLRKLFNDAWQDYYR